MAASNTALPVRSPTRSNSPTAPTSSACCSATSSRAPGSRTTARSRWCSRARPRRSIRGRAMSASPPARCATASSPSAIPTSSRPRSATAACARRASRAAPTTSAAPRSAISPAMRASGCGSAVRSSPLEIQYLGGMVYIETVDGLSDVRPVGRAGLSDAAFRRLTEFIDAGDGKRHQLRGPRPRARPAAARAVRRHQGADRPVGLPVRPAPAHRQGRGAADSTPTSPSARSRWPAASPRSST